MPKINASELKTELGQKSYSRIYFVYGAEKQYVKKYGRLIAEKIMGKSPSEFNFHILNSDNSVQDIADAVFIVPFMEEYNFVAVEDFPLTELSESDALKLSELIKSVPDTSVLLFTELTLTPAQNPKRTKILKELTKYGCVLEFKAESRDELKKTIMAYAKKCGASLSAQNAELIISLNGGSLSQLINETAKLAAFSGCGEITKEQIELIVTKNPEANIFKISEQILRGNLDKAYLDLSVLLNQKEEPIAILAVISFLFGDMYRVKLCTESGFKVSELLGKFDYTEKNSFRLQNAQRLAKNLSLDSLKFSLEAIKDADLALKSSAKNKERTILEQLFAKLALIAGGLG